MFQQDYLMRLIWNFVEGIRRSIDRSHTDPEDAVETLEDAISEALDMDASIVLGLQPESFASVLQVSGSDPRLMEYIARSLCLEADYLVEVGRASRAELRREQARALAVAFGFDDPAQAEEFTEADFDAMLADDGLAEGVAP